MSQGFLSRFSFGASGMRRLLSLWPPFRAAGIRVREIAPDFRSARKKKGQWNSSTGN